MITLKQFGTRVLAQAAVVGLGLFAAAPANALTPVPTDTDYLDASNAIFLRNEVTRCEITISQADFEDLIDNPDEDLDKNVTFRWTNSAVDETLTDVSFRVRGGAFTRGATRKSWKVDFNDFVVGRSFHGQEELNLNGEHNDATLLRRAISHDVMRSMGLPTPRISFVALYINFGSGPFFWSIQVNTEEIDEEFADSWFGSKDGNIYKCLNKGGSTLANLAKIPGEDYANFAGGDGERVYDEKNNDPTSDYTDLRDFIRYINDQTAAEIFPNLEHEINIDNFLRYLALNVAVGGWDDYWYGSNNYYMYYNTEFGRFEWLPYDYDNTVGMDFFGINWASRSFDNWDNGGFGSSNDPMADAVFDHTEWRRQWRRYLLEASDKIVDPALFAQIDTWHSMLLPYYDGTIEDGGVVGNEADGDQSAIFTGVDLPVNYDGSSFHAHGLKPFLTQRSANLITQVNNFGSPTPALPRVTINEVLPSNLTINQDEAGDFEDWVELYNDETSPVDLSGWHLSDDVTSPTKWLIPSGTVIGAKGYLLIYADEEPAEGPLHATYKLNAGGEHMGLFHTEAQGRVLVDDFAFPFVQTDVSFARFPDGSDTATTTCLVTPVLANVIDDDCGGGEPRIPPRLFVNEFMADNDTVIADELGEFDDWIEIYNDEDTSVDLSGLHLTDDLLNPTKWQFPAGQSIPAKGFLIVWADNTPLQGPLHTNFALGAGGESIGIYDNDENNAQLIHAITYGAQTTDVSSGLLPDGVEPVVVQDHPTPGFSNSSLASPTPSPSPTASPTASPSPSASPTPSASPSPSPTASASPSPSASASPTPSPSPSPSPTATASATPSPTASPSPSPSASPSPTETATATPSPSPTPGGPTVQEILDYILGLGGNPKALNINGDDNIDSGDVVTAP